MRSEDARRAPGLLSNARMGLGVTVLVVPRLPSVPWVGGAGGRRPALQLFARSLHARDFAFGLGPGLALRHDAPARGWVQARVLADAGALLGTLVAWRSLPRWARLNAQDLHHLDRLVRPGNIAGAIAVPPAPAGVAGGA